MLRALKPCTNCQQRTTAIEGIEKYCVQKIKLSRKFLVRTEISMCENFSTKNYDVSKFLSFSRLGINRLYIETKFEVKIAILPDMPTLMLRKNKKVRIKTRKMLCNTAMKIWIPTPRSSATKANYWHIFISSAQNVEHRKQLF